MEETEKLSKTISNLKQSVGNLQNKVSQQIQSYNELILSIEKEVETFPDYWTEITTKEQELQKEISKLEEEISSIEQQIRSLDEEITLYTQDSEKLVATEKEKRDYKKAIEDEIKELKDKNVILDNEIEERSKELEELKQEYTNAQLVAKEEISKLDMELKEMEDKLNQAKEENKLIVYLMDAGLMDVPEAEIISIISANPEGLTIDEIKQKVSIPSVRVQPTVNNLLDKILIYDQRTERYNISAIVQEEMNNR